MPTFEYLEPDIEDIGDGTCNVTLKCEFSGEGDLMLESSDLHEHMLDDENKVKTFTREKDGLYTLKLTNLPNKCVAGFRVLNKIGEHKEPIEKEHGELIKYRLEEVETGSKIEPIHFRALKTPDGELGAEKHVEDEKLTKGVITRHDLNERKIACYQPDGFDTIPEHERRMVVAFDGDELAKSMLPYIAADADLNKTVFIFIDSKKNGLERANEFCLNEPDIKAFQLMSYQCISERCKKLHVDESNVTLLAHSLACYPATRLISDSEIGGLILVSPAANVNVNMSDIHHRKDLSIYISAGALESAYPSPKKMDDEQLRDNTSRIREIKKYQTDLVEKGNKVNYVEHHSGHDERHIFSGLKAGVSYIEEHKKSLHEKTTTRIEATPDAAKHMINEAAARKKSDSVHLEHKNGFRHK